MKLSSRIKPISYLKAHAAEIVRSLGDRREPLIITQNGEAKGVLQDIDSYEQTQETVALLKILALGSRQIEAGQVQPAADVITRLRKRRPAR
ncbi:MAG: type II toxin-antitoxin system Phd/YefM family antitoxin [Nitrospira sp.]|nr:type II toxin-antitoxin system Phd/YefM family antitoxin [Nitrospira sp.]